MNQRDLIQFFIGSGLWMAVVVTWILGLFWAPVDIYQGEVYRIMYLHVPSAMSAFGAAFAVFIASLIGIRKRTENTLHWGRAYAEVGLIFTILTLATGSIWGKPTWGTWWTWDARLTTTFILFLMYVGYLLLAKTLQPGSQRVLSCSILGILIFVDVPIIYKSVTWFRTLHQPPSLLKQGAMSSEMQTLLIGSIVVMFLMMLWLGRIRAENLKLEQELESKVLGSMR